MVTTPLSCTCIAEPPAACHRQFPVDGTNSPLRWLARNLRTLIAKCKSMESQILNLESSITSLNAIVDHHKRAIASINKHISTHDCILDDLNSLVCEELWNDTPSASAGAEIFNIGSDSEAEVEHSHSSRPGMVTACSGGVPATGCIDASCEADHQSVVETVACVDVSESSESGIGHGVYLKFNRS